MKKWCLLVGLLLAHGAQAADLDVKARPEEKIYHFTRAAKWDGLYFGGSVGWLLERNDMTFGPTDTLSAAMINGGQVSPGASFSKSGVIAGGYVGVNAQYYNWVFGLEAEDNYANLANSTTGTSDTGSTCGVGSSFGGNIFATLSTTSCAGATTFGFVQQMLSYAALRARFGYAIGDWLPYIAGGASLADFRFSVAGSSSSGVPGFSGITFAGSQDSWLLGWNIGAGVEYMMTENWAFRFEGFYYRFPAQNFNVIANIPVTTGFTDNTGELSGWVVRAGVTWRWPPSII